MAFIFQPNNYILNRGSSILYEWKTFMTLAAPDGPGWVIVSSSDATSYNLSGDVITSGDTGTGGFFNQYAWFVIQSPTGRQFVFQLTSTTSDFFIGYSKDGLYTGGNATTRPTASDENVLLPSLAFLKADALDETIYPKCVMQFGADDSGENSFYIIGVSPFTTYKASIGGMIMEEILPTDKSNTNADSVVFYMLSNQNPATNLSFDSFAKQDRVIDTSYPRVVGSIFEGTSLASFSQMNGMKLSDYNSFTPSYSGKNIYSQRLYASAIIYGMSGYSESAIGFSKGIGKNMLSIGTNLPIGTIVNVVDLGVFVAFRDLLFPFPINVKCFVD